MNNEPPLNPDMLKMNEVESFDPDYWLSLAAEDYVTARILILVGINRLGAYHMQQAVEKYLKAFGYGNSSHYPF